LAVGLVSLLGSALWFVALPLYYRWVDFHVGALHVNSVGKASLWIPVGLAGVVLTAGVTLALGALWRRIASALLGTGALRSRWHAFRAHAIATIVADVA